MIVILMAMWQLSLLMPQINSNPLMQTFNTVKLSRTRWLTLAVCAVSLKSLTNKTLKSISSARLITTKRDKDFKTFSNELIKLHRQIATKVVYNDWICGDACLTVVEDGHKLIIGRDIFSSLGLAVVQQQAKGVKSLTILIMLYAV